MYPLLSQKQLDFNLWSFLADQMAKGIHLTPMGFESLLPYYASINTGMSAKVRAMFPNVIAVAREVAILPTLLNPY